MGSGLRGPDRKLNIITTVQRDGDKFRKSLKPFRPAGSHGP